MFSPLMPKNLDFYFRKRKITFYKYISQLKGKITLKRICINYKLKLNQE